ncbi:dienelactone hydrolase family protein [Flagellimonas lutaonensis]|uniref:Carbohydrate esterase n=1 Tax=Flagellimonas lutaonensis TaxID=516051 RepID=A0A0D5YW19_9FLAO|nr:PHB depolymerase family esterase [Allomuricauda lutaonensis]AKA36038.1 carbohydrate esterase [Allomuricauda lutaonensis]
MLKNIGVIGLWAIVFLNCTTHAQLIEDQQQVSVTENLRYYLYFPEPYEAEPEKEFGLLLFLHGGGESGANLDEIKKNGPPKLLAEGKQFPFLVLAPQNPHKKKFWNIQAVNQLLDSVVSRYRIDPQRIYLSGLSRGGSAAWDMAVQYPNKFAALAVVCGMAPVPYAHWLDKNMPIWVFHGADDPIISVSESDAMVAKLKEMGYDVQYNRYEGVGHDSWTKAFTTEALYSWLNEQKRAD